MGGVAFSGIHAHIFEDMGFSFWKKVHTKAVSH